MRHLSKAAPLLFLLGCGCSSTTILAGNFTQWPQGDPPSSIPGEPSGDSVNILPAQAPNGSSFFTGGVADDRFWFRDTACDQSVANCQQPARTMWFATAPVPASYSTGGHLLLWSGKPSLEPGAHLLVSVFKNHFDASLQFHFESAPGGGALVSIEDAAGKSAIGTIPAGGDYAVILGFNPGNGTYSVTFDNNGSTQHEGTLLNTTNSENWGLQLTYLNTTASQSSPTFNSLSWLVNPPD